MQLMSGSYASLRHTGTTSGKAPPIHVYRRIFNTRHKVPQPPSRLTAIQLFIRLRKIAPVFEKYRNPD